MLTAEGGALAGSVSGPVGMAVGALIGGTVGAISGGLLTEEEQWQEVSPQDWLGVIHRLWDGARRLPRRADPEAASR